LMIVGILALAIFVGPPEIGSPPDPSNISADPRPDWYLLWYFAVLALVPPKLEGAVIILAPLLIGAALFSVPLLSNKGERSPLRRPWSIAVVLASAVMIGSLWILGARSPWSPNFEATDLPPNIVGETSGPIAEGAKLFHDKGCLNCHLISDSGGRRGPDLSHIGDLLTPDEMTIRISNGGRNMPAFASTLSSEELTKLVAFLESRKVGSTNRASDEHAPAKRPTH
jgi:ubiquinol-cytochrome c reductase cytochrome b subunit